MDNKSQAYIDKGVIISKSPVYDGDTVTISYNGLLMNSGADSVYAYIGYGKGWDSNEYIPMTRKDGAFEAEVKVALPESLNVTFKDSANNWDNNSSEDYVFTVTKKASRTSKTAEAKETPKPAVKKTAKAAAGTKAVKESKAVKTTKTTAQKKPAAKVKSKKES